MVATSNKGIQLDGTATITSGVNISIGEQTDRLPHLYSNYRLNL